MKFTLSPEPVGGYPMVILSGSITKESLIELGRFIRTSCEDAGARGVILDCRDIKGALSPETMYEATPAYSREVGERIRVAYINPPPQWKPSDDQFSRDLAYNRGALLEVFESEGDALNWLADD